MYTNKEDNVSWLEFELLQPYPKVRHGVFLGKDQFDLGEAGKVSHQLRAMTALSFSSCVKIVPQVHGKNVVVVDRVKRGLQIQKECDGLMTTKKGVGLMIRHADCQAAIFYDPKREALAVTHCGWRGSVQNIYQATLQAMSWEYSTNPSDVRVCIGPSLGPTKAEFQNYKKELPREFWSYQKAPMHFDFWEISKNQLIAAGVLREHIQIAKECTFLSPNTWFSHRRDPTNQGRCATLAGLT